jgi:hypothetical protein
VFSDAFTVPKALSLYRHLADRAMTGFGIETFIAYLRQVFDQGI